MIEEIKKEIRILPHYSEYMQNINGGHWNIETVSVESVYKILDKYKDKEDKRIKDKLEEIIDDKFYRVHQSLGYFMIGYSIDEELSLIFIHPCNDNFEIDRDCSLCTYNYVTQEVEIFEKMDIELSSYLIHEIFYEIYKQIKNINSYIKESDK